jgi:hypothetical protein
MSQDTQVFDTVRQTCGKCRRHWRPGVDSKGFVDLLIQNILEREVHRREWYLVSGNTLLQISAVRSNANALHLLEFMNTSLYQRRLSLLFFAVIGDE